MGFEYQHYYNDHKAFAPPTGLPSTDYLFPAGQDLEPVIPENEHELYFYNKNYYRDRQKVTAFPGFDSITTELLEAPHHAGIPHWCDDPRTLKMYKERLDKGVLQMGMQYNNPDTFTHNTEIYGLSDPDWGADEAQDVQYQNVDNTLAFEEGLRDNKYAENYMGLVEPYDKEKSPVEKPKVDVPKPPVEEPKL